MSATAPETAGTYYYGACVDAVAGESDTTNNCSGSVAFKVEEPARPDLEVVSPSVSDSSPAEGGSFTLSATVRNTGDVNSAATTLRYYRSTDATISSSDTAVGTDAVGALAAAGSSAQSISLKAPSSAGAYYYGACVDTLTDESDTANNCSSSVRVDVEAPKYPNLAVGSPSVSDTSLEKGASFTLSATVSNTGGGESAATTLRYYRSNNSRITTSDTAVGTDTVATLAASEVSGESISLTAPSDAGTYYYGACVDSVTYETNTQDNCSASVQVTVPDGGPPAVEVHLFRPARVDEPSDTTMGVVAWTTGDRAPTVSISVWVWLVAGTAEEEVDFGSFTQLVEFNVADFTFNGSRYEAIKEFTITILDDTQAEDDETFGATMTLESAGPFVTLSPDYPDQLGITILANDAAGQNTVEVTAP